MQADQIKERLGETTFNDVEIMTQQVTTDGNKEDTSNAIEPAQTTATPQQEAPAAIMVVVWS